MANATSRRPTRLRRASSPSRLTTVTDPAVSGNPVEPRLTQSFDLEANEPGVIRAYYTDRRGHTWEYYY